MEPIFSCIRTNLTTTSSMLLYRMLLVLAFPVIFLKLWKFWRRYPNYRPMEALGSWGDIQADLWLHCASVGEVLAAKVLAQRWLERNQGKKLLITTVTPTGAEQVEKYFSGHVEHRYLPLDYSWCVKRALKQLHCPQLAIVETELWPNLMEGVKAKGGSIQIVNARLSAKSCRRYQRFVNFSRRLMSLPDCFLAHSDEDAQRFLLLGASRVRVAGNIKFDISVPQGLPTAVWREALSPNDEFVWVAASTHDGEDKLLLDAHRQLLTSLPGAKLVIVPRHPERFSQVYELAQSFGFSVGKRSSNCLNDWSKYDVLLGDSMGEMMSYLGPADVVFVGGSLVNRGGHNPIEAAIMAKPIIVGAYTFNFAQITDALVKEEAAIRVESLPELVEQLTRLKSATLREQMGQQALYFANANQGAVDRVLGYLDLPK